MTAANMTPACAEGGQVSRSWPCHWVREWPGVVAVRSGERLQQGLRLLQVGSIEPLGEPAIDRRQQVACLGALALLLPQASEAHGGAQLPRLGLLAAGNGQGPVETGFRLGRIRDG